VSAPAPPAGGGRAGAWLRAVVVLTRAELLRLTRTDEVWRYLLLPALLLLPVSLFGAVLLMSLLGKYGTVAVPPDAELDLAAQLEERDLDVVVRADPLAAWEAGEVDAAVVSVARGDGVGGARALEVATPERWAVRIVADTHRLEVALRRAAEDAGRDVLADYVALAGGDPDRDLEVADISVLEVPTALPVDPARGLLAYCVFGLGGVAFFFLSLPVVADRREGVTEAYRVLPVPPTASLWARLLALLALQLVAGALVVGNAALLLGPLLRGEVPGLPTLADLPGVVAAVVFVDALHVAVGVYAPNAKAANNASGFAVMGAMGLLGYGLFAAPPAWVPVAGVLAAAEPLERVVGVVATLAASAAVVAACGHLLATRVSLVLPGRE
jgi:hypothetical protein